jgi:hypothetical protein
MKIEVLEREEGAQALDLDGVLHFLSGQQLKGAGEGLFISPTSKEPLGEYFTGQVCWTSLEADRKFLKASPRLEKSGDSL